LVRLSSNTLRRTALFFLFFPTWQWSCVIRLPCLFIFFKIVQLNGVCHCWEHPSFFLKFPNWTVHVTNDLYLVYFFEPSLPTLFSIQNFSITVGEHL